jgi:single-strand DNA-binding protein
LNNLNSILLEGNLTRDPELAYTASGTAVCKLSIAVNRSYKKGDAWEKEVSFFDVTAFARIAEACAEYLKKGRGVRVVGRLKQDRWNDKDSGSPRSKVYVVAEHVEFKPALVTKEGEPPDAGDITAGAEEGAEA